MEKVEGPDGLEIATRLEQTLLDIQAEVKEKGQKIKGVSLMVATTMILTRAMAEVLRHIPDHLQEAAMVDTLNRANRLCLDQYPNMLAQLKEHYELQEKQAVQH